MRKNLIFGAFFLCAGIMAAVSCRRSDLHTTVVRVPDMHDARSVRIVTNAALDEVVGRYDGLQHEYEIDLTRKVILYHESQRLMSRDYQRQIEARSAEVGYHARVLTAGLNPPSLVPTKDGPFQMWPDRFTAVISVPGLQNNTDANIVVDAIAFARLGKDDPRVVTDARARSVRITYESLRASPRNIENAIASVGFDANTVPAKLGAPDALPHGWTPVRM